MLLTIHEGSLSMRMEPSAEKNRSPFCGSAAHVGFTTKSALSTLAASMCKPPPSRASTCGR